MSVRTRRELLGILLGGGVTTLAGCSGGGDGSPDVTADDTATPTTMAPTGELPAQGEAPRFRYDDHNSGVAGDAAPGESFDLAWSYEGMGRLTTTPTVADGTVYLGDRHGVVHALDLETAEVDWTAEVAVDPQQGIQASPTVADGRIVAGAVADSEATSARIVGLDAADGAVDWEREVGRFATSTAAIVDGLVYTAGDPGVLCLDAETGDREWVFDTASVREDEDVDTVTAALAIADGTVVAGTRNGRVHAVDAASGERLWSAGTEGAIYAAPTVVGGTAYVADFYGTVFAFDLATGDRKWTVETEARIETPLAATADTVYAANVDGVVYAVAADGTERWATTLEAAVAGAPVRAGDAVIVGTKRSGGVVALDAESGDRRWGFPTDAAVTAPVLALDGAVLVPTLGKRLHAIYG